MCPPGTSWYASDSSQLTTSGPHRGTVTAIVPPGRSTRTSSAIAVVSSAMCSSTSEATIRSNEPVSYTHLVGVDVSARTLFRRLGPSRLWAHPTPERVIDWAAIQPFGETESGAPEVRLRTTHEGLHRLRPGELADLLEDLRRDERRKLLSVLSPDEAADALEEMEPDELASLLREADQATASRLLARCV